MLGNRIRKPAASKPCFFMATRSPSAQKEASIMKNAPTIHSNTMGKETQYNCKILRYISTLKYRNLTIIINFLTQIISF